MTEFEDIYREQFVGVYRYVLSLCRNEAMAEEITQETFCRAMESFDSFRGDCKVFVWLCQIAKNVYFALCRKQKHLTDNDRFQEDTAPDMEGDYMDRDTAYRLHQYLHSLDEPYKEVFSLRVFGELPYSQIGELFGKTDSWARLIFYRAKNQLRRKMYGHDM